jgi:hypothetical protein
MSIARRPWLPLRLRRLVQTSDDNKVATVAYVSSMTATAP